MSSKNATNRSPSRRECCDASNAPCCPTANNRGINGSPCSPPSPWGIWRTTPVASSHRYSDGRPQNIRTHGTTWSPPSLRLGPSSAAPRNMRSYALTSSTDVVVAPGRGGGERGGDLREPLKNVSNTVTPCWGRKCILERRRCTLHGFGGLQCNDLGHQSLCHITCHDTFHPSIYFGQSSETARSDDGHHRWRHRRSRQHVSHAQERMQGPGIVEQRSQMLGRHP